MRYCASIMTAQIKSSRLLFEREFSTSINSSVLDSCLVFSTPFD